MAEQAGRSAAKFLGLKDTDLFVTGCWGNVNPPGGRNSPHTHPNNYLSGVYYVSLPGGASNLVLHDPRAQAHVMMPPVATFSPYTGNTSTLEVKEGRMVLFPGWLTHSVPVNASSDDRVSIAFNLMFRTYVEQASPAQFVTQTPFGKPRLDAFVRGQRAALRDRAGKHRAGHRQCSLNLHAALPLTHGVCCLPRRRSTLQLHELRGVFGSTIG